MHAGNGGRIQLRQARHLRNGLHRFRQQSCNALMRDGQNEFVRDNPLTTAKFDRLHTVVLNENLLDATFQANRCVPACQPIGQPAAVQFVQRNGWTLHFPSTPIRQERIDEHLPGAGHVDPVECLAQRAHQHDVPESFDCRRRLLMFAQPVGERLPIILSGLSPRQRPQSTR